MTERMDNPVAGIFRMTEHGCCGYIKRTELVSIKDLDEHLFATVVNGERMDLIPYKDLLRVVLQE